MPEVAAWEKALEAWLTKALAIFNALGDRPKMALTYAQRGLLAEERGDQQQALDWTVRSAALLEEFPHRATSTAPRQMARLTAALGLAALQESWQRCIGRPLPAYVRTAVERMIGAASSTQS